LPTEALQVLFNDIKIQGGKELGFDTISKTLGRLHLIDSSTISLCLTQSPWAKFRKTKGGIKLHLGLRFYEKGVLPDEVVITPANAVIEVAEELPVDPTGPIKKHRFVWVKKVSIR
jgi:hypothetical protein